MTLQEALERVIDNIGRHVRKSKGFETESWINPLTPVDSVAAFAMAKELTEKKLFDYCISVAPEGHVYGYFFELFGASVLSVHVDYPPRRCEILDELKVIHGKKVLILEDDVASGTTLRLVAEAVREFNPSSIDLYLGRPKDGQVLDHVGSEIGKVYLAEDYQAPNHRQEHETQFVDFFDTA